VVTAVKEGLEFFQTHREKLLASTDTRQGRNE